MKTAICFSGQLRGFAYCQPTFQFIIDHYKSLGSVQISGVVSTPQPGETRIESIYPDATIHYVTDDPAWGYFVSDFWLPSHSEWPHNRFNPAISLGIMCAKILMSVQRLPKERFDTVVLMRCDNYFNVPFALPTQPLSELLLARRYAFGGYCGRIMIGNHADITTAALFYNHLNDYHGNFESRWQQYLDAHCTVRLLDMDFHQVQANGTTRYKEPSCWGLDVPLSVVRPPGTPLPKAK